MATDKIEAAYKEWVSEVTVQSPSQIDVARLYELAYQIYLAKQTSQSHWLKTSGGKWLAKKLTEDGRFSNLQINRLSYLLDDIVSYNFWLLERNSEA